MAVSTSNKYTGDGTTVLFPFSFPYLQPKDVNVRLNGVIQDRNKWSLANESTVEMDTAPGNGVEIVIYRETDTRQMPATFYNGSTIQAPDLNDNFNVALYVSQETRNYVIDGADALPIAEQALATAQEVQEDFNAAFSVDDTDISARLALQANNGLQLPDQNVPNANNRAIRVNTNTAELEYRVNGAWKTAGSSGSSGVSSIIAGNGITLNPTSGVGDVTITASGGGGGGGGSEVSISVDPPANKNAGDQWWSTSDNDEGGGRLYIYTGSEWVDTSLPGVGTKGDRGDTGADGPIGPQGPAGTSPNDGLLTIKDSDGNTLGSFTANQSGNTEVTVPAASSGGGGGGGDLPAGTRMLFAQQNPPVGWSMDTDYQGNTIRIRSNSAQVPWVQSGGSITWDNAFTDRPISVDGTTKNATAASGGTTNNVGGNITVNNASLSTGQLASHTHSVPSGKIASAAGFQSGSNFNLEGQNTGNSGGGGGHNHGGSFDGHTHTLASSSTPHAHDIEFTTTLNLDIKYLNCCVGTKDS